MTVDATIDDRPRPASPSVREDAETLGVLAAGDDFAAFAAFCREFEARHPRNALALMHRCRAKERFHGPAAAAADAAENWSRYHPAPGLIQFTVNLMRRAGDFAGARHVLRSVRDLPGLGAVLPVLEWQVAVESGDPAAVEALLSAGPDEGLDALAQGWKAAGLLLLERPADALARMLAAIRLADQPAALLPALRRFTGESRQILAAALHERLLAEGAPPATDPLLWFVAQSFLEGGRHVEALDMARRLFPAEGALADRARMLAAQCAAALGDEEAAREHLSVPILKHCPPELAREMMGTLGRVVFDWRGPQVVMRLLARLPQFREQAGTAAGALDLVEGRFDAIIADFFRHSPPERLAPAVLFPFCSACIENSRWADLLRGIRSLPLDGPLPVAQLRRLRAVLSCVDDPRLTRPVTLALLKRLPPGSPEALVLRLATAEGPALEAAARSALRHLRAGNPAITLRFAILCEGEALFGRLRPETAEALREQALDRIDLDDIAQRDQIGSQRHLCNLIQAGFPEPRPEAVSIIAPVHRPCDLPNLAASLARQSWANMEAIVVANGELHESPLVAQALGGLPNVTILHDSGKNVGGYLNLAVAHASGDIVMRFDADDVYFADYVRNSVQALQATDAEIAGKHSCFVWFESARRVFLRNPAPFFHDAESAGHYGVGATHIVRRDVFREVRYVESVVRGEDYRFFEHCALRGLRNINLDPFNYLMVRRRDKAAHTWQVDDLTVLNNGTCYIGGPEAVPLIAAPDASAEAIRLAGL